MNPKISYIMITARDDYPFYARPELHLFETTGYSMKSQTMKDFEWIIVDNNYEKRKDYFNDHKYPFTVKHVPAKPNVWLEKGLPGVCGQYNKGIIYADGELLFFTGDSYMFINSFMETMWHYYLRGFFPLAWYMFDNSFVNPKTLPKHRTSGDKDIIKAPIPYEILGYKGNYCGLEHRFIKTFMNRKYKALHGVPWLWWFGCSSASLDAMLKINGFDLRFDGDKMLMDMDVGSRLQVAGYGNQLLMARKFFLIRPTLKAVTYRLKNYANEVTINCSKGLLGHSRHFHRYRANHYRYTTEDVEWIKQVYCGQICDYRNHCKVQHPWQYPFEHKKHPDHKYWFKFWMDNQQIIDLAEERELRMDGEGKYSEGTFVEA